MAAKQSHGVTDCGEEHGSAECAPAAYVRGRLAEQKASDRQASPPECDDRFVPEDNRPLFHVSAPRQRRVLPVPPRKITRVAAITRTWWKSAGARRCSRQVLAHHGGLLPRPCWASGPAGVCSPGWPPAAAPLTALGLARAARTSGRPATGDQILRPGRTLVSCGPGAAADSPTREFGQQLLTLTGA